MKTRLLAASALASLALAGCATVPAERMSPTGAVAPAIPAASGYFAADSTLPFHAPDFTRIAEADYVPAFEQGMAIQRAEVAAITANPQAPSFENTIVAYEKSGRELGRVERVFDALTGANTTDALDAIDKQMSPRLAAHRDAINLDPAFFARVKAVYDNRAAMTLTQEDARLLERTYERMVHAGAMLTPEQRERVKAINTELSTLTTQFGQQVREATVAGAVFVTDKAQLKGLSEGDIAAAAKLAAEKGKPGQWAIALQNTTQQPLLPSLENRLLRERLFKASLHRADSQANPAQDTRLLVARIAALRAEKAALFGNPDWATYAMWDRMAKTPKTALDFMNRMVPALAATQRSDAAALNAQIKKEGGKFTVRPWDWYRYANKVKAERYSLDEDKMMEYFQIDKVLEDGVFYMANQLYGLGFTRRSDIPVYHPDVWTYTVTDRDGSELGLFYFDPYQRPSKRGGAWMSNFVEQSHLWGDKPVIYNVLNIPKAAEGSPQLVSFDNVITMFHEFGHALHGLFADQKYETLSGTATARDFVEYPAQLHELWATDPRVLANYAKHHKTGATIPAAMIAGMDAAGKFNQGYDFGEVVEAALLDMKWHALSPEAAAAIDTPAEVDAFEAKALGETGLEVALVPPRYRSTYFNHIFSDPEGYSSGYYSYLWTQMLDHDSRKWFMDRGGMTRANGDHYRATVLSRGGTMDYFEMYRAFAGRDPDIRPLLEARGLVSGDAKTKATADDGGKPAGDTN
jgi:peptidyl-dipeptidase Dcp